MVTEIERKIYFYQLEWVTEQKTRVRKDNSFLREILLQHQTTNFDPTFNVKLENIDDDIQNKPAKSSVWKISKIRKSDLPQKYCESTDQVTPLNLNDDEGLYEPTHFIVVGGNIIAAEYNRSGISASAGLHRILNEHLADGNCDGLKKAEIKRIFRRDVYRLLDNMAEIRRISIQVATDYAKLLRDEDANSYDQMFAAADLVDGMYLQVSFGMQRSRKFGYPKAFDTVIRAIKQILTREDAKDNVKTLNLRGRVNAGDDLENINLLEQLLVAERSVTKLDDRTRGVNTIDMCTKITQAYNSLKDDLDRFVTPLT